MDGRAMLLRRGWLPKRHGRIGPAVACVRQSAEPRGNAPVILQTHVPHGFRMKLPSFLLLGLFSLTACAQSNSPSVAAQPAAQAKPAATASATAKLAPGGLATQPAAGT